MSSGSDSSEQGGEQFPEELRALLHSRVEAQRVHELAARVVRYFAETRRTLTDADALLTLALVPQTDAPRALSDFGLGYTDAGELRQTRSGAKFVYINEAIYQALGTVIVSHIQSLMMGAPYGLRAERVPLDAGDDSPQTRVFLSPDALTNDTLVMVIHGAGAVRAGMWARALCMNDSLEVGSILPYLREIQRRQWGVVVLNPNDNDNVPPSKQPREQRRGLDALDYWLSFKLKQTPPPPAGSRAVPGSDSPEAHTVYVWDHIVRQSKARNVLIVAHSYGGVSTMALLRERCHTLFPRLKAAAFTDAVHSVLGDDPEPVRKFISQHSCNWISSSEPLDTPAPTISFQPRVSAGHPKHEWTSASCMRSVFTFLERNLAAQQQ